MAFRSQRDVPGSGEGSFPDRTQLENVVGETLQYAAAACRVSKRGAICAVDGVDWGSKAIFELIAEVALEVAAGCRQSRRHHRAAR